jgi:hypothetical protein
MNKMPWMSPKICIGNWCGQVVATKMHQVAY